MTFRDDLSKLVSHSVMCAYDSNPLNVIHPPCVCGRQERIVQIIELVKKEIIGEMESIGKFVSALENPRYGLQQVQKEGRNNLRQEQRQKLEEVGK